MQRRTMVTSLFTAALVSSLEPQSIQAQSNSCPDHCAWVGKAFEQMLTIKPGMTRAHLLKIFATEGGLATRQQRTFVSLECAYFKVDVEFKVPKPQEGEEVDFLAESDADIITKVSLIYLGYQIMD